MSYQPKVYRKQGGDELVVASGGAITIESGGTLELESGGTMAIADGALAVGDFALADGKIIVGNASGKAAAVDMSGDASISNTGELTIGAGKVTSSMLADGAGLAALVTAGGGASATYAKTTDGAQTLLAANANGEGARTVLIVVTVMETFAAGDGSAPVFDIGETDTAEKFAADLNSGTAGDILTYAGQLTEEKALLVTGTAATGTGAGAISVTVMALPASA